MPRAGPEKVYRVAWVPTNQLVSSPESGNKRPSGRIDNLDGYGRYSIGIGSTLFFFTVSLVRPVWLLLLVAPLLVSAGCDSCRDDKGTPAKAEGDKESLPTIDDFSIPPPLGERKDMELRSWVLNRVKTEGMGRTDPTEGDLRTLKGFSYAAIEMETTRTDDSEESEEDPGPPSVPRYVDFLAAIKKVTAAMAEQEIVTSGKPVIVMREKPQHGTVKWEAGLPIMPDQSVASPLVSKTIKGSKVYVEDVTPNTMKSTIKDSGNPGQSFRWDVMLDPVRIMKRTGVQPDFVIFRWVDYDNLPTNDDDFRYEILVGAPGGD